MKVVVDTPVWSEFFRRSAPRADVRDRLASLVRDGEAVLLGPVRQELLGGIRDHVQFERLRLALRAFPDEPINSEDYEHAAHMLNHCRSNGVQGSNTDLLLCAVAARLGSPIFTLDQDFDLLAPLIGVPLLEFGASDEAVG